MKWFSVRNCVIRSDLDKLLRTINHHILKLYYTDSNFFFFCPKWESERIIYPLFFFSLLSISNISFCVLVSSRHLFFSFFFFYYFSFFCSIEIWKKFIFDHSICIHTCIHTLTYMYIHIYSRRSTWVARIGWQDRLF